MRRLLTRRLIALMPTLFAITVVAFSLQLIIPGGPAEVLAAQSGGGSDAVAEYEKLLGLDRPVPIRYVEWVSHAVQGDFGYSYRSGMAVGALIADRAGASLLLVLSATILATLVGIILGVVAAVNRRNKFGEALGASFGLGLSVPNFWLATLLVGLFALTLGWLPAGGLPDPDRNFGLFTRSLILPVIVLAIPSAAQIARQVRSAMIRSLESSYVRTARGMGVPSRKVIWVHAFRNSISPVVVLLPIVVATLVGGTVIVETIFTIPGLGSAIVEAVANRDFLVLQAVIVILAVIVLLLNVVSDVVLGLIDPRVRSALT